MKPYEKYKDSGVSWIGEIPEEWETRKLKFLSNIKRGASPRPIDDPVYFDDNGERYWVRISDISNSDKYLEVCEQRLSDKGIERSVPINEDDFFVSICASVGKPCISKVKACIHDGFVLFDGLDKNLNDYMYYLFETQLPFAGLGKLGTQLNLNSDTIKNISIPIHNKIAHIIHYLNQKTSAIDSLIADKQMMIELLKEKRQAIISEIVTKGLDKTAPMKDSGIPWIGDIPEGWEVKKLKYSATPHNGDRGSNYPSGDDLCDFGVPFISTSELQNGKIDLSNSSYIDEDKYFELGGLKIEVDDIIYCLRGSVGKNGISHFNHGTISSSLMGIRPKTIHPYFLSYLLNSPLELKQRMHLTTGSVSANLSAENVMNFVFVIPSIETQQKAVKYLDAKTSKIDTTIADITEQIEKLKEYRQAVISEVVTGKVDV